MWRYKAVCVSPPGRESSQIKALEAQLNELGAEGWEAVAVIPQADGWCVLFKMPYAVASF
jgi:hypothetical protein